MRSIMQKWGKHIAAVAVFLVLTVVYFAPAVFEGKSIRQGDMEKAVGMGGSQMEKYEKSAQPGEFSVWSDAMFGGMAATIMGGLLIASALTLFILPVSYCVIYKIKNED